MNCGGVQGFEHSFLARGLLLGLRQQISGVAYATPEESAPFPTGFAPLYYLRLGWKIVTWDEVAIRRASRDPNATYYGAALWTLSAGIICVISLFPVLLRVIQAQAWTAPMILIRIGVSVIFEVAYLAVITLLQFGLCHLVAKWFFGGTGTYMGVMRPLLLAWWVQIFGALGFIGMLAGGLAWIAVLMLAFEEAEGIARLKAFLIATGINFAFVVLQIWLFAARRHG